MSKFTHVIAIGPYAWARETDADAAVRSCAGHVPSYIRDKAERLEESITFALYHCTAEARVNEMGGFVRDNASPAPEKIEDRKVSAATVNEWIDAEIEAELAAIDDDDDE